MGILRYLSSVHSLKWGLAPVAADCELFIPIFYKAMDEYHEGLKEKNMLPFEKIKEKELCSINLY